MMNVLFATNLPSPYRVSFFNELSKMCNLTVLYERKAASDRNKSWKGEKERTYREIYLSGLKIGAESAFCPSIKKFLRNNEYDLVVLSGYGTLTSIYANLYMKKKNKPFIISIDGCLTRQESQKKYRFKSRLLKNADAILVPGEEAAKCIEHYGVDSANVFSFPFTSLIHTDVLCKIKNEKEKRQLKQDLGVTENVAVITVASFIYRKGIDLLLHSCKELNENIGIYIVGGVPNEEYLQLAKESGRNIHFLDFMKKESLFRYYQAMDIFVLPTREDVWGLVVNEAMANGLPVITTNRCGAGLDLIKDGINGYIIPTDDIHLLTEKINFLAIDFEKREKIGEENLNKIRGYTIEQMARRHMEIFEQLIYRKNNKK